MIPRAELANRFKELVRDRLGESDPTTWAFKTSEFAVLNSINMVEFFEHILDNHGETLPEIYTDVIREKLVALKKFYGEA